MSRNAMLAKIHIGKKDLGWDDDTYRAALHGRFGVASAAKLSDSELAEFCEYLRTQGVTFRPKDKKKDRARFYEIPHDTPYATQKRYICALWAKLGYEMNKIDTRVMRQFKVEKLLWLHDKDQLQTLTKDLYTRCWQAGLDPRPDQW